MPHVHVANPTLQDWVVPYRLGAPGSPELKNLRQLSLPRGAQIELAFASATEAAQFIGHLEKHGARDAAEVHGTLTGFSGLIYRDIGQIASDEIYQAHEAVTDSAQDRSVRQATRSALGFDSASRKPNNSRPGARVTETIIKEELPRGTRRRGNEVEMSLSVDPEGRSDVALPV